MYIYNFVWWYIPRCCCCPGGWAMTAHPTLPQCLSLPWWLFAGVPWRRIWKTLAGHSSGSAWPPGKLQRPHRKTRQLWNHSGRHYPTKKGQILIKRVETTETRQSSPFASKPSARIDITNTWNMSKVFHNLHSLTQNPIPNNSKYMRWSIMLLWKPVNTAVVR